MTTTAKSGITPSFPHRSGEQAARVADIIEQARDAKIVEASQAAEDDWVRTIAELAQNNRNFFEACTPGYYNNEGPLSERVAQDGFYGGGAVAFFQLMEAWRAAEPSKGSSSRSRTIWRRRPRVDGDPDRVAQRRGSTAKVMTIHGERQRNGRATSRSGTA